MIHISVNGEQQVLADGLTLQSALRQWQQQRLIGERYAVAINGEFVPRHDYAGRRLSSGDAIDIVQAVVGG